MPRLLDRSGSVAGPLVYWVVNWMRGQGYPDHVHDFDHILGVVSGSIQIEIEGRTFIYEAGQMATMRADISHEVRALEDGTGIVAARIAP